jgi:tubulin polyglutamylase TTLL6/13
MDKLKFDIRLYVLVLSCDPLKIFLYKEGLVRFATQEYVTIGHDQSSLKNQFIHLTNYSLNKENRKFREPTKIDDDNAHKRTLTKTLERLKWDGHDTDRLMAEMKDIIIKTLLPIQKDLSHNYHACQPADVEGLMCFEILGFDIIIDRDLKPLLLEVNHAPSFATGSPLDYDIKSKLFKDTFQLLGMSVDKKKEVIKK